MIQKFVNKWSEKINVLIHIHIFMKYHKELEKAQKEEKKNEELIWKRRWPGTLNE